MLTKLLKYDFKATGRIILPIAGGVLLLNFVSDLLGHYVNNTSHTMPWVGVFMGLLTLATFLGMLAVLAICFFASVQRYYKLLGEQGYLMLALPVHAWQHIAAKLICGVVWTLFGFFYFGICGTLTLSALDGDSFSLTGVNIQDVPLLLLFFLLIDHIVTPRFCQVGIKLHNNSINQIRGVVKRDFGGWAGWHKRPSLRGGSRGAGGGRDPEIKKR